jgi:hypothetical protein
VRAGVRAASELSTAAAPKSVRFKKQDAVACYRVVTTEGRASSGGLPKGPPGYSTKGKARRRHGARRRLTQLRIDYATLRAATPCAGFTGYSLLAVDIGSFVQRVARFSATGRLAQGFCWAIYDGCGYCFAWDNVVIDW